MTSVSEIERVEIERLGVGSYRLVIPFAANAQVEVWGSVSPEPRAVVGSATPVTDQYIEITDLPVAPRHYFHFHIDGAHCGVAAHRHIPLQGSPNFRDFGGYRTQGGQQRVRWGQLYRSGMLSTLTEADMAALKQLEIRVVCDFRRDDECQREPSRWSVDAVPRTERLPLAPGNQAHTLKGLLGGMQEILVDDVVEAMAAINREFVIDHGATYGRLLQLVLEAPGATLIHCAAGKDRTGFGAAIILAALGVSEADIMRDYMLTSQYLLLEKEAKGLMRRYNLSIPLEVVLPVIEARPQYLRAGFDLIDAEYGDFATYLREGLGFDESAQRELKAKLLV